MADTHGEKHAGGKLKLVVVTPEATALETAADFVAVPLYDGELGILPRRGPMIGRLGYGQLRVVESGHTTRLYVDGGFVQVADDVVTVLTGRAVPVEQLDPAVAAEQLRQARSRPAHSEETLAIRERQVMQSRAQLRLAGRGAKVGTH
ncbi:MAG: ATP synthase F1 subunit epsilon [Pirellulales bacterium]